MQLHNIAYYPVKSMRGIHTDAAAITPQGITHDREWLLSTPDGVFITARSEPELLLWQAIPDAHGLTLTASDGERRHIPHPDSRSSTTVKVWNDVFCAHPCDEDSAAWLSQKIGQPCRLHYLGNSSRILSHNQQPLSFADGAPYLLTSMTSLAELNRHLAAPVSMERFRANLVIDGDAPYAEDSWRHIRIGTVTFELFKPCSRCVIITIDPLTGTKSPLAEPLRTLAKTHRLPEGACFGVNMVALNSGSVTVSDTITILD